MREPKIGDEYFSLFIDPETGEHEWWIYRVRSIQNRKRKSMFPGFGSLPSVRYVYAIGVFSWTWGKRSSKAGDFGWLDPISDDWRKKWKAGEEPRDLFETKKAALKSELSRYDADDYDDPTIADKVFRKLENMLARS